ncbi:hypothetical protein [Streptomyces sp. MW-W600-10]|uniref:hypothetical protein n=1 Tax=Streptomyces sp. MW-W600-10 TaxID=2829819 RepID=UPI002109DF0A|nr:hypothetical protein [Streptomyces sp. MW-W600-10]
MSGSAGEVAAPVQSAQTGQYGPGEQKGVRGGQGHQAGDVGALCPVAQEFHGLSAQGRSFGRVLGRGPQHHVVAVPGSGEESGGRERLRRRRPAALGAPTAAPGPRTIGTPAAPGVRRPAQQRRVQGRHHRPGLGEFAQRTGHDVGLGRVEQPDQPSAYEGRCEQSGVQPVAGQPQRLGAEDRVPAVDEFGHQQVGAARVGGGALADGPVEEFARRFRAEDRRVAEEFGPQPGDPYPGGQHGGAPVGQPVARRPRDEPGMEPCE